MTLSQAFNGAMGRYDGKNFVSLCENDQILVTIWGLETDVNNGGFDQYYQNSAGNQACYAPAALRKIGAHTMAALVERANAVFGPNGPPAQRFKREREVRRINETIGDAWGVIDVAFFAYPDDISDLLEKHLGLEHVA